MPTIHSRHSRSAISRPRASRILIVTTVLCVLSPQPAVAQQTPAQAMAYAIARMMESMGFTGTAGQGTVPPLSAPADPTGMSSWPSSLGQIPQSFTTLPDRAANQVGSMADSAWGAMPGSASSLAGVWEDNQGGLLIVQGGFYRLYSACRGYIEGEIRVQTDRVELSNRAENFTQTFEFALDQGRLALRDQNGQLYLYRRLILSPNTAK